MILNVHTVVALFLAGVGAVLALGMGIVASGALGASRRASRDPDARAIDALDDRAHLLALVVAVLAAVRFLAWPFFYALLDSYVPDLAAYGVMCSFGVTLIDAPLVAAVQWLKPVALFGLGLWGLLALVDRRSIRPTLLPARITLAVPLAAVVLADCAVEAVYLVREKVSRPVTCCTRFRDTEAAQVADNLSPLAIFADASPAATLGAYFIAGAALVAVATLLARRRRATHWVPAGLVGLLGLANLVITQWSWIDAVAPRVLGLPYHHCPYELITDTPALGFAALCAVGGSAGLLWPAALATCRRRAPEAVAAVQRGVYGVCAVALASELLIVGVHVT